MRKAIVTGFVLLSASASAGAADVSVVGLTTGRAVVVIDGGKPRTLKVGETTPENIRLLSATSAEDLGWAGVQDGPDDWLMKPVGYEQLLRTARRLIARG